MDQAYLHQRIERFYEAQLSQEEENFLLRTLLKIEGKDPIADEALAVMLASRMSAKTTKTRKKTPAMRIAGIAASIAIILGMGIFIIHHPRQVDTFAYVSGKKIHDRNEIKNIVSTQLQDIGESTDLFSQTVATDFDDIREALTDDEK